MACGRIRSLGGDRRIERKGIDRCAAAGLQTVQPRRPPSTFNAFVRIVPCEDYLDPGYRITNATSSPCLESGAAGYIPTNASVDDLVHIVTAVAAGNAWCSDRFAAFLFSRIRYFADEKWLNWREDAQLTAREFEVIELLAEGLSNKEIAGRLNIETQTAKNHVHHLLEKLSVHKRMDAVAYARQRHWLSQ
ncbi:MAG TPA: response regulator transcription factor [Nitrospirales bacterium]|nr:response regulator transcription factor [Nitrospirales bacterium]HIA14716.1 response regulator transcription factor [Nitrospirales bacterium]HIC04746.1 response regulator transcription factor [Nitrospirales bacterium]